MIINLPKDENASDNTALFDNNVSTANNFMMDLVDEADKELPRWNTDLIIPKELWKPIVWWFLYIYNQKNSDRPENLCLYGYTDEGKSTFLNHLVPSMRKRYNLNRFGIIKISCLTNTTLRGLYQSILRELDWPFPSQARIQDLEPIVGKAVRERNCKLIIIDEFSQLHDKNDIIRQAEVLKALRNIPKGTLRPIVVVGVKKILELLQKDQETNNRFFKVEFPRFELVKDKITYFLKTVKALDKNLYDTKKIVSTFASDDCVLKQLYEISKGKMGTLVMIYEWTVRFAISENAKELKFEHLKKAQILIENSQKNADDEDIHIVIPPEWEGVGLDENQ